MTKAKRLIITATAVLIISILTVAIAVLSITNSTAAEPAYASNEIFDGTNTSSLYNAASEDGYINYNLESESVTTRPLLSSGGSTRSIFNLVVYICFSGETAAYNKLLTNPTYDILCGEDKSLYDYYYDESYGQVLINSIFPENNGALVVYQAPNTRSSYQVLDGKANRATTEKSLLQGAMDYVDDYFDVTNIDLDINDDGWIDAVSFLISGDSSSEWASLLWPHSWNFSDIGADTTIGGAKVGDYSFNFVDDLTLGVVCHEFFHVLGAPDLYHYDYDFVPVGDWDLMQYDADIPQYSLVYMRDKYLGVIGDEQIVTINHNGAYSLQPVTIAGEDDVLAYIIPTNKTSEYIMVEYRNPNLSDGYDSSLPGAGLVVYRIRTGVEGNTDARYKSNSSPDEVYVYRPAVATTGNETKDSVKYSHSSTDMNYSYLSPNNSKFSSVGATLADKPTTSASSRYDYTTIYYVDGTNTGIIIETISISNSSIEFRVRLNGSDNIDDTYFSGKIGVSSAALINSNEFSGVNVTVATSTLDPTYLSDITVQLFSTDDALMAANTLLLGQFQAAYADGERSFPCRFIVSDKGSILSGVFKYGELDLSATPSRIVLSVTDADGDTIELVAKNVESGTLTWESVLATQAELSAKIVAAERITVGVRKDGTAVAARDDGQWAVQDVTNVTSVATGLTHTLLLKKDLTVVAVYANDVYGETAVSEWSNIIMVAAGLYTSYGLTASGTVYGIGRNTYGQTSVSNWSNVVTIAAGEGHVAGITSSGRVYTAGDNSNGQCNTSGISNVVAVTCGNTFTAYLTADGRVLVAGELINKSAVGFWSDIIKISAGKNILLGLKSDGTVVACGDNSYGQLNVSELIDIEDIAAGEYHTAFLRSDGVVEFRGIGDGTYKTNNELINLKYDDYVDVTEVRISASQVNVLEGATVTVSAGVLPSAATYQRIIYTSSNEEVATVTQAGVVNCIKEGTVSITATAHGSGATASINITVRKYVALTGIAFATATQTMSEGATAQLVLVTTPANATMDDWTVTYESNFSTRVSVDANGKVTSLLYCEATVTATATDKSGNTFKANCRVIVISGIAEIVEDTKPNLLTYYYGDEMDFTGATFHVEDSAGNASGIMNVTADMISGYNKTPSFTGLSSVNQTVTVTYMDKSYTIAVKTVDYVLSVELSALPKQEFVYGDSFEIGSSGRLTERMASGKSEEVELAFGQVDYSSFNSSAPGIYSVTVAVSGKNNVDVYTEYEVIVRDRVSSILSMLTKKTYNYGRDLNGSELIKLYMASGAQKNAELSETVVSGYSKYIIGTHNITIEYTDSITGNTYQTTDTIAVAFQGSINIAEAGEGNSTVYYYIGHELTLTVTAVADGVTYTAINNELADLSYSINGYNKNVPGEGIITLAVYVRNTSGLRQEIFTRAINVYGVKATTSIALSGVKKEYNYGETVNAKLTLYYEDGTSEVVSVAQENLIYDPELVETAQTLQIKYLNGVLGETCQITIRDTVAGFVKIGTVDVYYGGTPVVTVVIDMTCGDNVTLTADQYTMEYDTTVLGEQTVTVYYGEGSNLISTTFILNVLDRQVSIAIKNGMKTQYKYGEVFNPYSQYSISWLSGTYTDIYYSELYFSCVPSVDTSKLGRQTIVVTYKPLEKEFLVYVVVSDYVANLTIASGAKTDYKYGEALDFSLTATYATGTVKQITAADCTSDYKATLAGIQTVTVSYGDARASIAVTVSDGIKSLTWVKEPGYTTFKYGEALALPGVEIKVEFESSPSVNYKSSKILESPFAITYNPMKTGKQTVTIALEGKSLTFSVTVEIESVKTLVFDAESGLTLNKSDALINAKSTYTTAAVAAAFTAASHLTVTVTNATGAQIDISEDVVMPSGAKIAVVNASNQIIYSYTYYLLGDANMDGVFDANDVKGLAELLFDSSVNKSVADIDGDGSFTLTDLVKAARKATDSLPVNAVSRGFITDVKGKEDDDEE